MTDTCIDVLRRWIPKINEDELLVPGSFALPHLPNFETSTQRISSVRDLPVSGFAFDIKLTKLSAGYYNWPQTPTGQAAQSAYTLYFFAQLFKSLEEIFAAEVRNLLNPYDRNGPNKIDGDPHAFEPHDYHFWSSPLFTEKLASYGLDAENLHMHYRAQRLRSELPKFKKILLDVYGFSEATATSPLVYVEFKLGLTPLQEALLKVFYLNYDSFFKADLGTAGVFEMPLDCFRGIDAQSFKEGKALKRSLPCQSLELEQANGSEYLLVAKLPYTTALFLKPQIDTPKRAELDETLRVLAKDQRFVPALKSAHALTQSS